MNIYLFFFQGPPGPPGSPGEKGSTGQGIQEDKVVLWKLLSLALWTKFEVVFKLFKATDSSIGIKFWMMALGFLNHCAPRISH